ncbi:MAG TPA: phosphocholine cytidylyltransferase family protein [Vicinamibacterales bacterium]|nr:phosphocholine cytidylyltransferase family protein [Vicinamibacterales bacterium]
MRGVILAAGKGSRLNGTAGDKPKCLVTAGGRTLIERQIDSLEAAGIDDVVVVVGCQAPRVRAVCGQRVTYVENVRYAETNSMYSLWLARALLYEGFVVMNCDVLFHPVLLRDLLSARHPNALLLAYRDAGEPPYGDEEMKVHVRCGRVTAMSKHMAAEEADGENVGIVKIGPDAAPTLVHIMDRLVGAGDVRAWAPRAFGELARVQPLHAIGTRGYPWIEIDFPEDYQRAVNDVLPAIDGDPFEQDAMPRARMAPARESARLATGTDA